MKILKILWHIVGIACSAMILPSFVSSITTALLSLQPQRMVIFFHLSADVEQCCC